MPGGGGGRTQDLKIVENKHVLLVLSTFERNTECTTNIIHDQVFSFTFVKFKMEGITQSFSPKSTI